MLNKKLIGACALAALFAPLLLRSAAPAAAGDDAYGYGGTGLTSVGVGGVAAIRPKYEGSNEYEVYGFPVIYPEFGGGVLSDRLQVRGADDVRYRLLEADGFELGPLAGYAFGRDEDDGDLLRGLGEVDDGIILGGYVGYRLGPVLFDVSYHHIVSGDDTGYFLRFGGEIKQPVSSNALVTARLGTTFADDDYMDSYFGISPVQALNSVAGLSRFEASSGIKDVYAELETRIDLTYEWQLRAGARYARLVGDAADSPIVESENQFTGYIGAAYRFDVGR